MAAVWKLEIVGGDTKTFADWGIVAASRSLVSQAEDTLVFRSYENFNASDWLPYGSLIRVTKDDVGWFYGKVIRQDRVVGQEELVQFQAAGPWWYLNQLIFQQDWKVWSGGVLGSVPTSHLMLNMDNDGNKYTTLNQILTVLNYCLTQATAKSVPAPYQIDETGIPAVEIPIEEVRDLTCAEVLHRQLRWAPDAVTWFDYSTSPPTLKIKRRADLSGVTIPFGDNGDEPSIQSHVVTPRNDLVKSEVKITYEQTNFVDGVGQKVITEDVWPALATADGFDSFMATVDLEGGSIQIARAAIETQVIDPSSKAYWKSKEKWLADIDDADITISDEGRTLDAEDYPNELVDGDIADWMHGNDDVTDDDEVFATIEYKVRNASDEIITQKIEKFAVKVKATSLATGSFESLTEYTPAEPVPTGLAQFLHSCVSVLHYEGTLVLVGEDVAGTIRPGTVLNLTGGRSEWATMNALVQTVSEDIDSGTTTVTFGAPKHLGVDDIIQLLRMNRFRRRTTATRARIQGITGNSNRVELPNKSQKENSTKGGEDYKRLMVWSEPNPGDFNRIVIDPSDWPEGTHVPGNLTVKLREVEVCMNGVNRRVIVLCSEDYAPPS